MAHGRVTLERTETLEGGIYPLTFPGTIRVSKQFSLAIKQRQLCLSHPIQEFRFVGLEKGEQIEVVPVGRMSSSEPCGWVIHPNTRELYLPAATLASDKQKQLQLTAVLSDERGQDAARAIVNESVIMRQLERPAYGIPGVCKIRTSSAERPNG